MKETLVLFMLLLCANISQTLDREESSNDILENSLVLPEFSWIDPLSIQVTFPGQVKDKLNLRAAGRVADIVVPCLFNGIFEKDILGSAVVSGCINNSSAYITIYSSHLPSQTSFIWNQDGVTNVANPYTIYENDFENNEDFGFEDGQIQYDGEKRAKRGTYDDEYYEYYEEEYYDNSYDVPPEIPSDLILQVKLGYEVSFLEQMNGDHNAAKAYCVEVATHGSIHMRHPSLGTRIHLEFISAPQFIPGKTLSVGVQDLKQVQKAKTDSLPLIVFVKTDDTNETAMGVSFAGYKGGACDEEKSAAILKWRSNPLEAAMTFVHENGHLTGQLHDEKEDERRRGKTLCEGTGIMSKGNSKIERPAKWSECSAERFKKWFQRGKGHCLITAPICDNGDRWATPCTCGTGDASTVCLSSHSYCWKKYFGDAPYQCLSSDHLEKALAIPQKGDLVDDDDTSVLTLMVDKLLLKQKQQEKLIANLIIQLNVDKSGKDVSSSKMNSEVMLDPSIDERFSNQENLIKDQQIMMIRQERLIENLINQLNMEINGTEVLSNEMDSKYSINPSLEERVENQEKPKGNMINQLDMEGSGEEVLSSESGSKCPPIEERLKNQEILLEHLIDQIDIMERNETSSKDDFNQLMEERIRDQENLMDNLIEQLDMERNGTEISSNKINEKDMINPEIETRLSLLEKEKSKGFRTCDELQQSGVKTSGFYELDPDGIQIGHPPIKVYCNFGGQVPITEILHDNDKKLLNIPYCNSKFCHAVEFTYNAHVDQIFALMELSSFCDQTIEYNCNGAPLSQGGVQFGAWVDRHGEDQVYFHGANHGRHTCSCEATNTCFGNQFLHNTCNCDNTAEWDWMKDSGKLTNITALPVMSFKYGPFMSPTKQAKVAVGRLRCGGRKVVNSVPRSCKDLKLLGETRPGLYFFQDEDHQDFPKMSYCQLDQPGYGDGMESNTHWLKLSSGPGQVFFAVEHDGEDITNDKVMTYSRVIINEGGGMDGATGIFTAPVEGVYDFNFSGMCGKHGKHGNHVKCKIHVYLNDVQTVRMFEKGLYGSGNDNYHSFSRTWVFRLKSGDKVTLKKIDGDIDGNSSWNLRFIGILL